MKSILFIITLFVINFVNSQTIRVKVYETVEYFKYDTSGILNAITTTYEPTNFKYGDCEYVIDLTNNKDDFYRNGVLEAQSDITYINYGDLYIVNFLYDGFDVGVVISLDPRNETFDWFSRTGDYYEISKGLRFEIIKGL